MKENNLICIYQMRKSNKCYLQYKIPNNTILPMQTPGTARSHRSPYKWLWECCVCVSWLLHLNNKHSFQKLFRNSFFPSILSHFASVTSYFVLCFARSHLCCRSRSVRSEIELSINVGKRREINKLGKKHTPNTHIHISFGLVHLPTESDSKKKYRNFNKMFAKEK